MSLLSALSPTAPIALGGSAFGAPSEDSQEGSRRYRERLLATAIAGPQQRHLALAAIIVSALAFAAAAPFAQLLLMPVAAFIPAYEAALVLIDLITAVMLFGQFAQRGGAALLALAAGYLFDGLMTISHALSFPGLLTPTGWLSGGPQTTAWLYMFWHGGFPLCVMAYVGLKRRAAGAASTGVGLWRVVWVAGTVIGITVLLTLAATKAHDLLPALMTGTGITTAQHVVIATVWAFSMASLLVLLWNRPYSVLDLWLIVVSVAWLFDLALSGVLNAHRFDLGFYAGRLYGLLAAGFVLAVLLVETGALQTRLGLATAQLEAVAGDLARRVRERTAALRASERRFRDIAEVSGDWMWETDREHRFTLVLGPDIDDLPLRPETLIGRTRWEVVGADPVTDEVWARHKADLDAHRPFRRFRYEFRSPGGAHQFISISGKPVFDETNNFLGYRGTSADETATVTARHQAEAAEALLRRVFETSQDLILVTDHQGALIQVSPSAMSILGYNPDEMVGRSGAEFLYWEDLDNTRNEMRTARRAGTTQNFECRYVHKQGRIVSLWWKGVWSASEQQHFFVGRDITDRKAAETALRESEQAARAIIESALDAVIQMDETGIIAEWNSQAEAVFGWSRNEALGRTLGELIVPPGYRARHEAGLARFLATGRSTVIDTRFVIDALHRDGREIKVELAITALRRRSGYAFTGFVRDLTQQIAIGAQLRESEEHLKRAQRLAQMGSDLRDLRTGEREWSDETYRIFGVSRETFAATLENVFNMIHPEDQPIVAANRAKTAAGMCPAPFEYRIIRPDGEVRHVYREWELIRDEAGNPAQLLGTIQDITERRQTEDQLRQAQKMEAIGNLTGGMAHDFNNLLGVVIGNLDLLRDRQSGDPDADELSGEALDAALRGADLTRRLLAFARRQPLQPTRTGVNELIAGIVKLLERTLGEQIQITLDLNPETWPVVVDAAQLESALTNLATNARDAMPRGGQLRIATGNRPLDADYASQHAEVTPGDYVMIEVSDTGIGMSPEVATRIFEPFYTTKERGKGTGLGLSMVFGFIKQSGGHINVYSEVGIGTIFRLYLPRADAAADAGAAALPAALVRGSGETMLAVEDNAGLRRVVVRQLTELGYRVLEAEDAQTALRVLESERVDVLFTDVVMPGGTSGYELARTALSRWPAIKIVLTSGFPDNRTNGDANAPNLRLLSKPYRRDDLGRLIREVLDS